MAASVPKKPNLNGGLPSRLDGKRYKLNLEGLEYIDDVPEENNNKERIAETDVDGE